MHSDSARLRILWVKALKLLPVDTGGRIRSFHILRALAERHDVTVLTYYDGGPDAIYHRDMESMFEGAVTLPVRLAGSTRAARPFGFVTSLHRREPFVVTKFESPAVRDWLTNAMVPTRYDVAVCDFLSPSLNFPASSDVPTVLFQHNVESVLWERKARTTERFINRRVFEIEARRLAAYEPKVVRAFDHVVAVSETDRAGMSSMAGPDHFTVVPTGVDVRQYASLVGQGGTDKSVVFVGSMDWEPNVDGMLWFCREVWPRVLAQHPDAHLSIVGRNPPSAIESLRSAQIDVTGRVDTVIPYLTRAQAIIVPLLAGGGTRLKIYEAMAAGRAVVSTSIGAEGLDVEHGRDIVLADNPVDFAASVSELLTDAARRERVGLAAAATAARFDWTAVSGVFEQALRTAIAQRSTRKRSASPAEPIARPSPSRTTADGNTHLRSG